MRDNRAGGARRPSYDARRASGKQPRTMDGVHDVARMQRGKICRSEEAINSRVSAYIKVKASSVLICLKNLRMLFNVKFSVKFEIGRLRKFVKSL